MSKHIRITCKLRCEKVSYCLFKLLPMVEKMLQLLLYGRAHLPNRQMSVLFALEEGNHVKFAIHDTPLHRCIQRLFYGYRPHFGGAIHNRHQYNRVEPASYGLQMRLRTESLPHTNKRLTCKLAILPTYFFRFTQLQSPTNSY